MFKRDLVSPLPQDYKPKTDLVTKAVKPFADTAVNYGKMLAGAYGSVPLSIGSFAARKVGANETAENLAQKAINLRNKTGYGGKDAPSKAVNTTVDALIKTYVAANIPKTIASGVKYLATPAVPAVQATKQVVPEVAKRLTPQAVKKQTFSRINQVLGRSSKTPVTYQDLKTSLFKR